jgi:hypothetical protein
MVRPQVTREEFVEELRAAVREAGYEDEIHHLEAEGRFALASGESLDLERLYADVAGAPPRYRAQALSKIAITLVRPPRIPDRWDEAKAGLYPVVKRQIVVVAEEAARLAGGGPPPVFRAPITPHLQFELGLVAEKGMLGVPAARLEQWGVSPEAAFQQAGENLAARSAGDWRQGKEAPRVRVSPWRDGLDVSRLFMPFVFEPLRTKGRPVVVAPTPSLLLVADSEDDDGLFQLGLMARRIVEKEKVMFALRPLRMGEDGVSWEDWLPPVENAARVPLRALEAIDQVRDYTEHAQIVRRLAANRPTMALPALSLIQAEIGGMVLTVTVWRMGRPTALPKADLIVLAHEEEAFCACAWEDVVAAPGVSLEEAPGYPTRFVAATFPEEWQIEAMRPQPWNGPPPPEDPQDA